MSQVSDTRGAATVTEAPPRRGASPPAPSGAPPDSPVARNSSPNLAPTHELPTDASTSWSPSLVDVGERADGTKADKGTAAARMSTVRIILSRNRGLGLVVFERELYVVFLGVGYEVTFRVFLERAWICDTVRLAFLDFLAWPARLAPASNGGPLETATSPNATNGRVRSEGSFFDGCY